MTDTPRLPRDGKALVAILRRLGLVLESDPEADSFPDWHVTGNRVFEEVAAEYFAAELLSSVPDGGQATDPLPQGRWLIEVCVECGGAVCVTDPPHRREHQSGVCRGFGCGGLRTVEVMPVPGAREEER